MFLMLQKVINKIYIFYKILFCCHGDGFSNNKIYKLVFCHYCGLLTDKYLNMYFNAVQYFCV